MASVATRMGAVGHWTTPIAVQAAAVVGLLVVFRTDAGDMAALWWGVSTYGHCLFVAPIAGWLVWQRRGEVARTQPAGWPPGLLLVLAGGLVWLVGQAGGVALFRHAGLVLTIQASVVAILGPAVARACLFPLFYLVFLIPFGDEFVAPMQVLTARMTAALLHLTGFSATLDGIFITTPHGWFEVAEACAGVKFLIAMVAYAALVAHVGFRTTRRRVPFMLAAVIVPVLANVVRAWGTIVAAEYTSIEAAGGFDHLVYGWFFFAFVALLIMAGGWRFFDRRPGDAWLADASLEGNGPGDVRSGAARSVASPAIVAPMVLAVAAMPLIWDAVAASRGRADLAMPVDLPQVPGWSRVGDTATTVWTPRFDGADHRLLGRYGNDAGDRVDIAVALYGWQDRGRTIVGYGQGAVDPQGAWTRAALLPPIAGGSTERLLGPNRHPRVAVTFWQAGGQAQVTRAGVKIAAFAARLTGGDRSAATMIVSADGQGARRTVERFLASLGPPHRVLHATLAQAREALAMCGIAGLFHLDTPKPVDPARLHAMADAMAHRGPDGSGVWTAQGVGLAHRRLSIIDVAGSPQPMEDDGLVVTYNGEIYNFHEVRRMLEAGGARFRTGGDTEVLLHGWRAWGPVMLDRLNGMFAFALFDARRQTLFLARDRLGVKPLHYAPLADGSVAFASELKGLLAHPGLRREVSPHAIEDFFAWGYVPDDACILAGVHKLPAGHHLTLTRGRPLPNPVSWWDVDFSQRSSASDGALEDEMRERLSAAVTSRMVADVPLGAFLSGGVDSSTVVALMAEASRSPVQTCSIGFDSAAHDETRYAGEVAARFATDHRTRIVAADDFAAADQVAGMFDEPFADASALATWRVSQLARERVTVALSGDGADEIFAGYRRHRFHQIEERVRRVLPAGLRAPVFGALAAVYPKADWAPQRFRAKSTLASLAMEGAESYARGVGVTLPAERAALFSDHLRRQIGGHRAEDRWVAAMRAAPAQDGLDAAQYADLKIWLPGDILTKVDRTSMAVSLEAREPLLDHRLVEFAATLPTRMRLRSGAKDGGGKWLMKRAMRGRLPDDILHRRKMGFVTPVSAWFRGPLAPAARDLVRLAETGWFERDTLVRIVDEHIAGRRDHGRLLWQLTMFERSMRGLIGQ